MGSNPLSIGLHVNEIKMDYMNLGHAGQDDTPLRDREGVIKEVNDFKYLGGSTRSPKTLPSERCKNFLLRTKCGGWGSPTAAERESSTLQSRFCSTAPNHNIHDNRLKQTEAFKYLGAALTEIESCQTVVAARANAVWCKWRELTPFICDKQMSLRPRAKVYKSAVRPVLLYGAEKWAKRETNMKLLEKTEIRMLRWIRGVSLKGQRRSEKIRDKVKEARLRWFRHVKRSDSYIRTADKMKVIGKRSRWRQK